MLLIDGLKEVLEQYNAQDILLVDLRDRQRAISDYVIVASVTSKIQMSSVASYISKFSSENGQKVISTEGLEEGNWGLINLGSVIIHLFRPEVREYYNLDEVLKKSTKPNFVK